MHSASTRFNSITLFTFTVMGVMCILNFGQGYLQFNPKAQVELSIDSVSNFIKTSRWDQASFKYTLKTNLSSLYTWNLKQLFVYVECQWVDPKTNFSSRTIATDFILELPLNKTNNWTFDISNQRMDYLVRDVYNSFRGNTLKFSLNVEYMPIVGFFFKHRLYEMEYQMPNQYTNENIK